MTDTGLTALYADHASAERAAERLRAIGVPEHHIELHRSEEGDVVPGQHPAGDGLFGALSGLLVPESDLRAYERGLWGAAARSWSPATSPPTAAAPRMPRSTRARSRSTRARGGPGTKARPAPPGTARAPTGRADRRGRRSRPLDPRRRLRPVGGTGGVRSGASSLVFARPRARRPARCRWSTAAWCTRHDAPRGSPPTGARPTSAPGRSTRPAPSTRRGRVERRARRAPARRFRAGAARGRGPWLAPGAAPT